MQSLVVRLIDLEIAQISAIVARALEKHPERKPRQTPGKKKPPQRVPQSEDLEMEAHA